MATQAPFIDPFAQVNEAATQAPPEASAFVDPFAPGYEKPKAPLMRGAAAAGRGTLAALEGVGALTANAAGADTLGAAALKASKDQSDLAGKDTMRVEDVNSAGSALDFLQYALGYLGTQFGANALGGVAGRGFGGLASRAVEGAAQKMAVQHAGTVAGLAGTSLVQEVGQIYPDAIEQGVADPINRALVGGAVAASADVLPEMYLLKRAGLLGKAAKGSGVLREAGKVAGAEAGTELFQTYVERAAAGQPVTGAEATSDYVNSVVLGALGGGALGGIAGAYNKTQAMVDGGTTPNAEPAAPQAQPAAAESPAAAPTTPPAGPPGFAETPASALSLDIPADAMRAEDPRAPASDEVPALQEPLAKTSTPEPAVIDTTLKVGDRLPVGTDLAGQALEGVVTGFTQDPETNTRVPLIDDGTGVRARAEFAQAQPTTPAAPKIELPPGEVKPGFAKTADDLITESKTPTPQIIDPFAVSTKPRETIKPVDAEAARGEAMARVEKAVETHVAGLPFKSEKTAPTVVGAIKRAAEKALAGNDPAAAKATIAAETRKLLKGKVSAPEATRVADQVADSVGDLKLESKAATQSVETLPKLYHGSNNDVTTFAREGGSGRNGREFGAGIYLTDNPAYAQKFGSRVQSFSVANARLINEYDIPGRLTGDKAKAWAVANGYDGIRSIKGEFDGKPAAQIAVFNPDLVGPAIGVNDPVDLNSRGATVEQIDSVMREQGDRAVTQVQALLGTPKNLQVTTYLADRGAGSITLGKLKDVISINLAAKDTLSVANHEAFHYLEHRVLPAGDLAAVRKAFAPGAPLYNQLIERVQAYDRENGTALEQEVRAVPAETRAYAFEFWMRGELEAKGIVDRAFRAIRQVIERVQNFVAGMGFTSYEDVFRAVERGYYGKRYGDAFAVSKLENVPPELVLRSQASLNELAQRAHAGEIPRVQLNTRIAELLDSREAAGDTRDAFLQRSKEEARGAAGAVKRAYLSYISSGENLARHSVGYKNVFNALTAYAQRKNKLIAEAVDKKLSTWVKGSSQTDKEAVSKALLDRTVNGFEVGSIEYNTIYERLTKGQRAMFDQATQMVADSLEAEFVADQGAYGRALGQDSEQYREWFANRRAQVDDLKAKGYFPERRYGDHVVHAYVQGAGGKVTLYFSQHQREADARIEEREIKGAFGSEPNVKVEYGYRYRAEHDGSLSFQQFLDMASRYGVAITQQERERLAKALVASDSIRRARLFRRKNVAGYSEDGMRVLAEFGVAMANKIAYHEIGSAVNDTLAGRAVQIAFDPSGNVSVASDPTTDLWAKDGAMGGYFRNLADSTADFVLSPRDSNKASRALRGLASVQFLGGSMAAGMVQLTSVAMNTTPWLSQYTGYTDAFTRSLAGYKTAMANHSKVTDIPTLLDENVRIPGVDEVEGLRRALQIAAQDGTTLDTEIYQIMGLSRGQEYSFSGATQKAIKAWMAPFRITEQWNRTGTFIAAFKLAKDQNKTNDDAYRFAQESVYATQFRYDEANRPALARGEVGSLLFVFKTYPIFMLETLAHLAKVAPGSAVFMLLTMSVMAGVEGLPFAEDLEDVIDTIAQRLFNSPFNTKRALRNVLKSASEAVVGADLSSVMMHGVANELTDLSFASRVGMGNLIPGTRIGAADADYKRVMGELLGPVGTIVQGYLGGASSLSRGDFNEAVKQAAPLAAQNFVKGVEQWQKGYASDIAGRKLKDVNGWEAAWQTMGFSSSALSQAYELDRMDRETVAFYKQAHDDFVKDLTKAVRSGDSTKVAEIATALSSWNASHPEMPIAVSPAGLRRHILLAGLPLNQRTFLALPKGLRGGSEYALGLEAQ